MPGDITTLEAKTVLNHVSNIAETTKVYDMYAPVLNYKQAITSSSRPGVSYSWVPEAHKRRLKYYEMMWSYWNNISRDYRASPESGDTSQNDDLLELGDAEWLSEKIKSKILGSNVQIMVNTELLESHIKTLEKLLENSEEADIGEVRAAIEEKLEDMKSRKALTPAQEAYLKDWWHDNGIYNIINSNESKAGYCGDCVYKVYHDGESVKLTTYDPGLCFPDDYSQIPDISWDLKSKEPVLYRFMLAWEVGADDSSIHLYREVYELRKVGNEKKCYCQKAYYAVSPSSDRDITDMNEGDLAEGNTMAWEDIGLDFIPFVWIANNPVQGEEPFGISNLHFSIDMLDNMITAFYDLSENASYLGGATLITTGKAVKFRRDSAGTANLAIKIRPGRMYNIGEDGDITLLDTSKMQDALLKTIEHQEYRFLRNNCIPDVVAGKLKGTDIPSGVALALMMQPLVDKIKPIRQSRYESYAYLFYYVMRMMQEKGDAYEKAIFKGNYPEVSLKFGDLMPTDDEVIIKKYVQLGAILDNETILEMAKQDGIIKTDLDTIKARLEEQRTKNINEQKEVMNLNRFADESGQE